MSFDGCFSIAGFAVSFDLPVGFFGEGSGLDSVTVDGFSLELLPVGFVREFDGRDGFMVPLPFVCFEVVFASVSLVGFPSRAFSAGSGESSSSSELRTTSLRSLFAGGGAMPGHIRV